MSFRDIETGREAFGASKMPPSKRWHGLKMAQMLQNPLLDSYDHNRAVAAAAEQVAAGVVMEVDDAETLKTISLNAQGDASLHTVKAWEQRYAMRRAPPVREVLHRWWMAVVKTTGPSFAEGEEVVVSSDFFLRLYKIIFEVLALRDGDTYDEVEATECAREDWQNDSINDVMPRNAFMDSVFQLADLYST